MKSIPLTQGKEAIIDDDDFELLSRHKWFAQRSRDGKTWYARRYIYHGIDGGKMRLESVAMHREILGLQKGDRTQGDHFNGDGLDNRRRNLRRGTETQNKQNRHRRSEFLIALQGREVEQV